MFTVMEQPVAKSYGDGKFELVTHESVELIEHDPLFRRSAHVGVGVKVGGYSDGVGVGVGVGAVGASVVAVGVRHSFQPCLA